MHAVVGDVKMILEATLVGEIKFATFYHSSCNFFQFTPVHIEVAVVQPERISTNKILFSSPSTAAARCIPRPASRPAKQNK